MTVESIVIEYLEAHGFDGLCNEGCGCGLSDLAPCGELKMGCSPAYANTCTGNECACCYADDMKAGDVCYREHKQLSERAKEAGA